MMNTIIKPTDLSHISSYKPYRRSSYWGTSMAMEVAHMLEPPRFQHPLPASGRLPAVPGGRRGGTEKGMGSQKGSGDRPFWFWRNLWAKNPLKIPFFFENISLKVPMEIRVII